MFSNTNNQIHDLLGRGFNINTTYKNGSTQGALSRNSCGEALKALKSSLSTSINRAFAYSRLSRSGQADQEPPGAGSPTRHV